MYYIYTIIHYIIHVWHKCNLYQTNKYINYTTDDEKEKFSFTLWIMHTLYVFRLQFFSFFPFRRINNTISTIFSNILGLLLSKIVHANMHIIYTIKVYLNIRSIRTVYVIPITCDRNLEIFSGSKMNISGHKKKKSLGQIISNYICKIAKNITTF